MWSVMTMVTTAGVRIHTITTAAGTTSGMSAASGRSAVNGMRIGAGIGTGLAIPMAGTLDTRAADCGLTSKRYPRC